MVIVVIIINIVIIVIIVTIVIIMITIMTNLSNVPSSLCFSLFHQWSAFNKCKIRTIILLRISPDLKSYQIWSSCQWTALKFNKYKIVAFDHTGFKWSTFNTALSKCGLRLIISPISAIWTTLTSHQLWFELTLDGTRNGNYPYWEYWWQLVTDKPQILWIPTPWFA